MSFDIDVLAANIKKYRTDRGIRQYTLAEMLNISPQSVSKWEQGLCLPDIENLCRLSEIFSVTIDDLLNHKAGSERVMIGIDGGGTKTEFILFSEKGNILQRVALDGCNPNICGLEKTCQILKSGVDALSSSGLKVEGIYVGMAGYLSGDNGENTKRFLKSAYPNVTIGCNSDILNVAAGTVKSRKYIVVICGTGSNVCAVDGTEIHRVGGWGYLFDMAGSGYDIGRDAVIRALAENDGIGQKTLITELIEKKLGANIWDSINHIYAEDKSYVASFAKEVFEAYHAGDWAAREILEKNMGVLAERINFAAEKYRCGDDVIISGGIMKESGVLLPILHKTLRKGLRVIIPELPQIYGACVLCDQMFGPLAECFQENFTADYRRFIGG